MSYEENDLLVHNGVYTANRSVLISRKSKGGRTRVEACFLLILLFSELSLRFLDRTQRRITLGSTPLDE